MRATLALGVTAALLAACASLPPRAPDAAPPHARARRTTFANPLDLDYRFMPDGPSWRQAADPMITRWKGDYYLFASKSGGYWYSPDMREWTLVRPDGYDLEAYAPTVLAVGDRMFYTAHKLKAIYATSDPKGGHWRKVADLAEYADPDLFQDDDGRVYLYYGSGLNGSISAVELDPAHDFRVVGGPFTLLSANYQDHGWERSGPDNLGAPMTEGFRIAPYVEGSWMTRHDGVYYLQYSAPGTVWASYADGVYTSRSPTAGFTYAPYSPFSYKPGGFIGSAGHAGTFRDDAGDYWRVVTMVISVKHKFERRLGIFPAGFDRDGVLRTNTYLGDYPQYLPGTRRAALDSNRTGWMLVSGGRAATASSSLPGHPPAQAFDEDVRTTWSASTGNAGEWLAVDLGAPARIDALQVNLGDDGTRTLGRTGAVAGRYVVDGSTDGRRWTVLLDRRDNTRDAPHDYAELDTAVRVRWLRITNVRAADGGTFSVRDLRAFGRGAGSPPARVATLAVRRHADDSRGATLSWSPADGAEGYVVRFGVAPGKLYASFQVGNVTTLTLNSLNRGVPYWFTVDAINASGVAAGGPPVGG